MSEVCAKHVKTPAFIYGACIGCELEGLRAETQALREEVKRWHEASDEAMQLNIRSRKELRKVTQQHDAARKVFEKQFEVMVEEWLREIYEWGYVGGQNNPNGYIDEEDRDRCVNDLLRRLYEQQW